MKRKNQKSSDAFMPSSDELHHAKSIGKGRAMVYKKVGMEGYIRAFGCRPEDDPWLAKDKTLALEIEASKRNKLTDDDVSRILKETEELFAEQKQRLAARVDPKGKIAKHDPRLVRLMGQIMGTKTRGRGNEDDLALELGKLLIVRLRKAPGDHDNAERMLKDISAMRKRAFTQENLPKRILIARNLLAEYRRYYGDPQLDLYAFDLWLWGVTQKIESGLFPDPTIRSSWTEIHKDLGLRI